MIEFSCECWWEDNTLFIKNQDTKIIYMLKDPYISNIKFSLLDYNDSGNTILIGNNRKWN